MQIAPPLQRCEANGRRPTKLAFISHFLDKWFLRMPATLRSYRKQLVKILSEADKRCEFCLLCILYYCHSHVGLHSQCTERQKNKNVQLQMMEQSRHWTTFYNNKSAVKSRIKRSRIENVIIISFKERIIYTTIICKMSCRNIESFGTHHKHNIKSCGEHLVFLRISSCSLTILDEKETVFVPTPGKNPQSNS